MRRLSLLAVCVVAPACLSAAGSAATQSQISPVRAQAAGRLLIRFKPALGVAAENALLSRSGLHRVGAIPQLRLVVAESSGPASTGPAVSAALAGSSAVSFAERDGLVHATASPTDPYVDALPWVFPAAGLPAAWDLGLGSRAVEVAVVDTGVGSTQADLAGAVAPGYDFVNSDADPSDDEGHGTAVAETIAAGFSNGIGGAGVCQCTILPVKALGSDGSGTLETVARGVVYAADQGARIINLSLGAPSGSDSLAAAIAYAQAKGALVVAAAGNDGLDQLSYPAAYPGVLSVAATDETGQLADYSNRGSWVQLAAPGCTAGSTSPTAADDDYSEWCGTSFASPLVAGIGGLALSLAPSLTAAQVADALEQTAHPLADVQYGTVDAFAAMGSLGLVGAPRSVRAPQITGTARSGLTLRLSTGVWSGAGKLGFTVRWQRCSANLVRCVLRGAAQTRAPFTVTLGKADVGKRIRAQVTATSPLNPQLTALAVSHATGTVAAPKPRKRRPARRR